MNLIKRAAIFSFLILSFIKVNAASNTRSDSIDIVHNEIHLTILDTITKSISGYDLIHFKSRIDNINSVKFDLLQLQVDSVVMNSQHLSFTQGGEAVTITLPLTMNTSDSADVSIYYHGIPAKDASWGGWYNTGQYIYSMGVAFTALPHSYGRCWHPCFDNFVERATYESYFTVASDKTAASNGLLLADTDNGNGTHTLHWNMLENIPSYLACVAVSRYAVVRDTFHVGANPVPVELYSLPQDSAKMKNSFQNLEHIFDIYNEMFGPYRWDKVGYVVVPFMQGAMEHATLIAYPAFGVTNDLTWEGPLVAHELAHHWFGDLTTCETAQDMWLNEGWCEYAYRLFFERYYGHQKFIDSYRANHLNVVQSAHSQDGGSFYAVSGVPDTYTYGATTYKKGSDVAHSLRAYMGDTLFFRCLKSYFDDMAFQSTNSNKFRDHLAQCSGINLDDFFSDWVSSPGFASFMVDSFAVTPSGSSYVADVFMRQKLDNAPHYYNNVPLELTLMSANMDTVIRNVVMSGYCASFAVEIPFMPVYIGVNLSDKISAAVTADNLVITKKGAVTVTYGKLENFSVTAIPDTAFVRIEHVFSSPDPVIPVVPNLHISDYRYWKIDGVMPAGFDATAYFTYNGTTEIGSGYLDNWLLSGGNEDSIVVLYRKGIHHRWSLVNDTNITRFTGGSKTDAKGSVRVKHLTKGEYALAIYNHSKTDPIVPQLNDCTVYNSMPAVNTTVSELEVMPSITAGEVTLHGNTMNDAHLKVFNLNGAMIWNKDIKHGSFNTSLSTAGWPAGMYFVNLLSMKGEIISKKLIVVK